MGLGLGFGVEVFEILEISLSSTPDSGHTRRKKNIGCGVWGVGGL
jgi:hypothetical protein